jgi:hypothetical protein
MPLTPAVDDAHRLQNVELPFTDVRKVLVLPRAVSFAAIDVDSVVNQ